MIAGCIDRHMGAGGPDDNAAQACHLVASALQSSGKAAGSCTQQDAEQGMLVSHSLTASGFDASEDGTGRGTPIVPTFIHPRVLRNSQSSNQVGIKHDDLSDAMTSEGPGAVAIPILEAGKRCGTRDSARDGTGVGQPGDPMYTLQRGAEHAIAICLGSDPISSKELAMPQTTRKGDPGVVAFTQNQCGDVLSGDVAAAMGTNSNASGRNTPKAMQRMTVRRLTPTECARLQGFPDTYLDIDHRGKPASDSVKYRALGNSMAVPVMRHIGEQIQRAHDLTPPAQ